MATATATAFDGRLWTSDCRSSHSLTKPFSGGSAAIAKAPMAKVAAVTGIRLASPPRLSRSRLPVADWMEPAPRNSKPLNAAWLITCSERRGECHRGELAVARRGEQPGRADADEDQSDVLRRRIGEQALEIAGEERMQDPEHRRGQTDQEKHHAPPARARHRADPSRRAPRRRSPSFTIAPLISAETWLGASGCALGSQTWTGTTPALAPKPRSARRNIADATPAPS